MKVSISPYKLKANSSFNALDGKLQTEGLLVKVEVEEAVGFASYHVFPELGDLSISKFTEKIRNGDFSNEAQLIVKYAEQDAQDRKMNHDPLAGSFQIENHYLFANIDEIENEDLASLRTKGFRRIKVKVGRDPEKELNAFKGLTDEIHKRKFKIRFDFNNSLSENDFTKWLHKLSGYEKEVIDYIEDPSVYDEDLWLFWQTKQGVSLALDVRSMDVAKECTGAEVLVLKPAKLNIIEFLKKLDDPKRHRYVVTHYMDHMVGLAQASAAAMKLQFFVRERLDICGLLPFSAHDYSGWPVEIKGPHLVFDSESGIGFSKQLAQQEWELIYES